MKPFRSRILLFTAYLFAMMAFMEEAHAQTKGKAHFEAGVVATQANNMPLAFKEFLAAAKEGHADSQFNLGVMYE